MSDSKSNSDDVEKNVNWSVEIDTMLSTWCDNAKCFEYMHQEGFDYYNHKAKYLSMYIIISSAITGTVNIGIGNTYHGVNLSLIFGSLAVISSIANVIQDKLGLAQSAEAHKRLSNSWMRVRTRIESELVIPYKSRKDCFSYLRMIKSDINLLINEGVSIPKHIREKSNKQFKLIDDLHIPEICGNIRHTIVHIKDEPKIHRNSSIYFDPRLISTTELIIDKQNSKNDDSRLLPSPSSTRTNDSSTLATI